MKSDKYAPGKYVIGTGYYRETDRSATFFRDYWYPNTVKYAKPEHIVVINAASPRVSINYHGPYGPIPIWFDLPVNPQCGRRLTQDVPFSGWALGFIQGALFAYSCGCDFIYKEQDCLALGPWAERFYDEAGKTNSDLMLGELYDFPTPGYLEQCLVLLKYDYIMQFLSALLALPQSERKMKPEQKFSAVMKQQPERCDFCTFGFGGNRPFDADDSVFYIQKPRWNYKTKKLIKTPIGSLVPDDELELLREKGLLEWPKDRTT